MNIVAVLALLLLMLFFKAEYRRMLAEQKNRGRENFAPK